MREAVDLIAEISIFLKMRAIIHSLLGRLGLRGEV